MELQPQIDPKDLKIGCLNCSTATLKAPMGMLICVGFGMAIATKDGQLIYDGEEDLRNDKEPLAVKDIEEMAAKDPDHDWRIIKEGPLHGETFQRHGVDNWVCIDMMPPEDLKEQVIKVFGDDNKSVCAKCHKALTT